MKKIAIVEDEKLLAWSIKEELEEKGYNVDHFPTAEDFLNACNDEQWDFILLDIRLPGKSGLDVLKEIENKNFYVIVMTAYSDLDTVISSMKAGAADFIKKPFKIDELCLIIDRACETMKIKDELVYYRSKDKLQDIIGNSEQIKNVKSMIDKVATTSSKTTVLILGESGSGKELVARGIHNLSEPGPFIVINCTALPSALLESELFGYEKGAFTDAKKDKKGLFELANNGTLFLDEIGDMELNLQSKLLRVIEDKKFKRVGGITDVNVSLRIVAATNKDLRKMVEEGTFRQDLYFRLSVFPIILPPLKERGDDIIEISNHFINVFNQEFGKKIKGLSNEAVKKLKYYDFPGNIRELKNIIERAMILETSDHISAQSLMFQTDSHENIVSTPILSEEGIDLEEYLHDCEKKIIMEALERSEFNQTKAAKLLGISREVLRYRMAKYK